jgi:hypothetical protein
VVAKNVPPSVANIGTLARIRNTTTTTRKRAGVPRAVDFDGSCVRDEMVSDRDRSGPRNFQAKRPTRFARGSIDTTDAMQTTATTQSVIAAMIMLVAHCQRASMIGSGIMPSA